MLAAAAEAARSISTVCVRAVRVGACTRSVLMVVGGAAFVLLMCGSRWRGRPVLGDGGAAWAARTSCVRVGACHAVQLLVMGMLFVRRLRWVVAVWR